MYIEGSRIPKLLEWNI